jgi:hypothetical protein
MDPYLEMHWEDVHTRLIGYIADELQPQLSDDLIARMEEKVYVEDEGEVRLRKPDVRVVESLISWEPSAGETSTAVVDEPIELEAIDILPERSVLIYDAVGHRIVTAIEVLSPWNKTPGVAMGQYLEKRKKYISSQTNLVEIDLIRVGDWTQMIGPFSLPDKYLTTYRVSVAPANSSKLKHYRVSLRAKLPTIKVPLRAQDKPVTLNLQGLIEKAYTMGRYNHIDYSQPCKPPLVGADAQWASELLAGTAQG